ncbi:uncharacterized protein LOC131285505 [Anopheles ziemanni]|uniref:uncharacterized protein LOC131285505 n=1 Tax=Anopheles ziemanni TaxID=345580 RepID=UPI00265D87AD|nr:uncharacterized protein LOC131285505 [Anopheles ziemanni]
MMDRNSLSGTLVSSFCRICTTNNDVDWSIYETLNEDEGTTNLHMMLVKLYPTVFNESQVLCDEALKWPTKICKECKAKVIESYKFYERCTKSARSLRTIASKEQPTTDTLQEEKDDHPAVIKMEFIECEEPIVPKEECDSDDHSSTYKRFYRSSPTEDVFSDTEDSRPAPTSIQSSSSSANKMEQIQSTKQNANLKASFTGTFLSGGENSKLKQSDKSGKYKTTIVYNLEKEMTISAQNMKTNQQTQDENDDPLAQIKMEFVECEELTELKKEYDPDDQISECRGFGSVSPTEDVFKNDEESCSSTANEPQLKPSISFCEDMIESESTAFSPSTVCYESPAERKPSNLRIALYVLHGVHTGSYCGAKYRRCLF